MIPSIQPGTTNNRRVNHNLNHNSMMTRHRTRGNIPRPTHQEGNQRVTMRGNNPIYHLRSIFLHLILLGIFPQKIVAHHRTRVNLAPYWSSIIQPITNPPTKHSNTSRIRSNSYMGPARTSRKQLHTKNTWAILYSNPRNLFHNPPSIRVCRSLLHNCRLKLRIHLLRSHRVPWPTCKHRNHVPSNMPITQNKPTFLIKPPLRI
ncbi:hypothetical protein B7P43_CG17532 [Cryptotermes secundus]|uniref:Uncharacterized protein n=1 Tax=Cryptotermes secundus TaxID=105785 RepID=A0A2J7Q0D0_9NEOP|nr:hypothetical protein B7P43_CG17532 [Cryptotermes secundus]